jgi:hypothetical protein
MLIPFCLFVFISSHPNKIIFKIPTKKVMTFCLSLCFVVGMAQNMVRNSASVEVTEKIYMIFILEYVYNVVCTYVIVEVTVRSENGCSIVEGIERMIFKTVFRQA